MKTEIRVIPIFEMNIAEYNPRKTLRKEDPEYEKLERSIDEFGYLQLIVWNEATGNVVSGNQKIQIFIDKGISEAEAIVICEPDLLKEKTINIALNNRNISSQWDSDKLKVLLDELLISDLDVTLTGFEMPEIDLITIENEVFADTSDIDLIKEYKEPEKQNLKCPHCGHIDSKERYLKA